MRALANRRQRPQAHPGQWPIRPPARLRQTSKQSGVLFITHSILKFVAVCGNARPLRQTICTSRGGRPSLCPSSFHAEAPTRPFPAAAHSGRGESALAVGLVLPDETLIYCTGVAPQTRLTGADAPECLEVTSRPGSRERKIPPDAKPVFFRQFRKSGVRADAVRAYAVSRRVRETHLRARAGHWRAYADRLRAPAVRGSVCAGQTCCSREGPRAYARSRNQPAGHPPHKRPVSAHGKRPSGGALPHVTLLRRGQPMRGATGFDFRVPAFL